MAPSYALLCSSWFVHSRPRLLLGASPILNVNRMKYFGFGIMIFFSPKTDAVERFYFIFFFKYVKFYNDIIIYIIIVFIKYVKKYNDFIHFKC
jgi:hypothetical protein